MGLTRAAILWCLVLCIFTLTSAQRIPEESSEEDELISGGYILPKQIFNGGKPFYVDKDPISGQLDFSSKKPAGIEPEANEVIDPKEKIVLNNSSPNFHDFLNLPVKYSSSKFVYPLVSSSYANLKYQGNNKNFVSNHKNYTTNVSPPTKYFTANRANITRLHPSTFPHSTTDKPAQRYTPTASTPLPVTKNKYAPTKKYVPSTTLRDSFRPTLPPTTTTQPPVYTTISTSAVPVATTTIEPTTQRTLTTETPAYTTTNYVEALTTAPPVPTTTYFPTTTNIIYTTAVPDVTSYRPRPPFTTLPSLDAAEVYNSVGEKKDPGSMSLEDIFNVFSQDSLEGFTGKNETSSYDDYSSQELPASPPAPFAIYTTQRQPVNIPFPTELIPQMNPQKDSNNYVQYNVQQPSSNVVNYHVPAMNSIVISPDQNSTSFVIGSQQGVGSSIIVGTGDKPQPMFGNGQQIHYGTVINEQLNPQHIQQGHTNAQQGPPQQRHPGQQYPPQQNIFTAPGMQQVQQGHLVQTMQQAHDHNHNHPMNMAKPSMEIPQTQELLVQSNIRFPSEHIVNGHGSPVTNNYNGPTGSGSSAPNPGVPGPANPVVFPKNEVPDKGGYYNMKESGNPVVFQQDDSTLDKADVLTLNQQKMIEKKYPRLPESLTPPNPSASHKWPNAPTRHHSSTPPNMYNEFPRKPGPPGPRRPTPDRPLPNILPQFRPNAKISHGHSNFNREPGNIHVPPQNNVPFQGRPKILPPPPPFAHRRTPILNRYNFKGAVAPEPMENRRVYKVPPPFPHNVNRMYLQRQQRPPTALYFAPQRPNDAFIGERHVSNNEKFFSPDQVRPERLPAFEEEDFMINDPPTQAVKRDPETFSLEPVVTLQMLKNKKKIPSPVFKKPYQAGLEQPQQEPSVPQTLQGAASGQSPVYVVYPVKPVTGQYDELAAFPTEEGEPVVLGQRGDQGPLSPSDANKPGQTFEYENTPFSVVRDQPQEPILVVKNKSQTHENGNFPYPLEKPDPVFAEFSKQQEFHRLDRNSTVEIIPRVVNKGNTAQASDGNSPIAIAYKPTEAPVYYQNHQNVDKFSRPNLASQVIPEIKPDSPATEETDTRGQYYEKDFMAPFYPSISLSEPVSSQQQGWSVFTASTTDASISDKNNINRIDLNKNNVSAISEKFDSNRFQPELQGGFKPIYPPDYRSRQDESSIESIEESSLELDPNTSISTATTSTTPAPTTTFSSSSTPNSDSAEMTTKRVKSNFETSLEALLFGDENYDDEETDKNNDDSSSS